MAITLSSSSSATLLFSFIICMITSSISAVDSTTNATDFIRTSCNATLYPDLCYTSLSGYSNAVQRSPCQLALVAIKISLVKARKTGSYISNLTTQNSNYQNLGPRTVSALHDCRSTYSNAVYQMKRSLKQMTDLDKPRSSRSSKGGLTGGGWSFRFMMSNVQTWMSAALTYEDTCTDGFEAVPACPLKYDVCNRTLVVKKFTSNALALVNSFAESEASR